MEVSVSTAFFRHVYALVGDTCLSPQWWVTGFLDTSYGIGTTPHTWIHMEGYTKLLLQANPDHHIPGSNPSPSGTLLFKQKA